MARNEITVVIGKKDKETTEKNRSVLRSAFEWAVNRKDTFEPLAPADPSASRIMLNGNQAIALGALYAGLIFLNAPNTYA